MNAVRACTSAARGLHTEAMGRARVFVDLEGSARHEAGDLVIPIAEGAFGWEHVVGELGRVLSGALPGRRIDDEVTLFESLGIAAYDLAVARFVHARALERGVGVDVELGGLREG